MEPPSLDAPKPGPVVIAANVAAMLVATLVVSVGISSLWDWDPCHLVSGVILGAPALVALSSAYSAVFRPRPKAASTTMLLSLGFAFFATAPFLGTLETLWSGGFGGDLFLMWLISWSLTASALGCAYVNWKWSRELAAWEARQRQIGLQASPPAWRFSLRELFLWMLMLAVMIGASRYFVRGQLPQMAEHVGRDQSPKNLPEDATDVCYQQYPRGTLWLEFTTTEASFLEWARNSPVSLEAESSHVRLKPIQGAIEIERYLRSPPGAPPVTATFSRGWHYYWSVEDRLVEFAFDANTGRVYYRRY